MTLNLKIRILKYQKSIKELIWSQTYQKWSHSSLSLNFTFTPIWWRWIQKSESSSLKNQSTSWFRAKLIKNGAILVWAKSLFSWNFASRLILWHWIQKSEFCGLKNQLESVWSLIYQIWNHSRLSSNFTHGLIQFRLICSPIH